MRSKDATFRLRALEPLLSRSDAHWIRHCKIDNPSLYRYCQSTLGRPCYALGARPGPIQIRLLTRGTCVPRQFVYGGTLCPLVLLSGLIRKKVTDLSSLMTARKTCSFTSRPWSVRALAICKKAKSCATKSSEASKARPQRSICNLLN